MIKFKETWSKKTVCEKLGAANSVADFIVEQYSSQSYDKWVLFLKFCGLLRIYKLYRCWVICQLCLESNSSFLDCLKLYHKLLQKIWFSVLSRSQEVLQWLCIEKGPLAPNHQHGAQDRILVGMDLGFHLKKREKKIIWIIM